MIFLRSQPEIVEIDFSPIPEFPADQAEEVLERVQKRYLKRGKSYGGFVLRNIQDSDVNDLVGNFKNNRFFKRNRVYTSSTLGVKMGWLHEDKGVDKRANDITMHHTTAGGAEVVLLQGSSVSPIMTPIRIRLGGHGARYKQMTNDLFDDDMLHIDLATRPSTALRTTVTEGDLLVFDSTQPHAFRPIADLPERVAEAHYFSY